MRENRVGVNVFKVIEGHMYGMNIDISSTSNMLDYNHSAVTRKTEPVAVAVTESADSLLGSFFQVVPFHS